MHILVVLVSICMLSFSCIPAAAAAKALVAPISYDPSTSLYAVSPLGGAHFDRPLLLNLASSNLWLDCIHPLYKSPTLQPVLFHSSICNSAKVQSSLISGSPGYIDGCSGPATPICSNFSCTTFISGSTSSSPNSVLWTDTISLLATNGRNPGSLVRIPKFAFACGDDILLNVNNSVPSGAVGAAGLSRAHLALPTQLAAKLSMPRKFAYCLPRSGSNGKGVLFFGGSPYVFLPGMDFSESLHYTPLLNNPQETDSYFIGVKSISVGEVELPIDSKLLKLRNDPNIRINGKLGVVGGTSISSTVRYTQLESSIYDALSREFKSSAAARGIKEVGAIKPFETCFNTSTAIPTRVGYNVPEITFSLQGSGNVKWTFDGANSVVAKDAGKVICLAFQRADFFEPRSIILGTFQQQDALLQFDLADSKLGFVPLLLGSRTSCSNFNFTSTA